MDLFIYKNSLDINESEEKKIYRSDSSKKNFSYVYKNMDYVQSKRIIHINERRKQNGN